jgi:bile acid-coenzyme A ligase
VTEVAPVAFAVRLAQLAAEASDAVALVSVDGDGGRRVVDRRELDGRANALAHLLAGAGVGAGDRVVVGLPRSVEQVAVGFAAWKLGATVVPLRHDLPDAERDALLALAGARVVVADLPARHRVEERL